MEAPVGTLLPDYEEHRAEVVRLACEEGKSNSEIGAILGYHPATIHAWLRRPEYVAAVKHWHELLEEEVLRLSSATKANRLKVYDDLVQRIYQVIDGRAESLSHIPGGASGLLVKQVKTIGTGQNAYDVAEYLFDAALTKELRAALEQMAKERGQWSEKSEQNINITEAVRVIKFETQRRNDDPAIEAEFEERTG